jgi:hypothetical protein
MTCLIKRFAHFRTTIALLAGVASCAPGVAVGASFENLSFESAVIGTPVNYELPTSQAMPGWVTNNWHEGYIGYDTLSTGATAVSIQDGLAPYGHAPYMYPIQGSYSVLLQTSYEGDDAWISQVGDVPGYANSLMFMTESRVLGYAGLVASINGTNIPVSLYSSGPVVNDDLGPVQTFIGDIRQFAGHNSVELRFTGDGLVDAVQFSTIVVPEPSTIALLGMVALGLFGWAWWRRQRAG